MKFLCAIVACLVITGCTCQTVEVPVTKKVVREKFFNPENSNANLIVADDSSYCWLPFKTWLRAKVGQECEAEWK